MLWQLVIIVIDEVMDEDRRDELNSSDYSVKVLPDGIHRTLPVAVTLDVGETTFPAHPTIDTRCFPVAISEGYQR